MKKTIKMFSLILISIFAINITNVKADEELDKQFEDIKIALSWINSWVRFFHFLLPKAFTFVLTYGMIVMVIIWLFLREEDMCMA